MQNIFLDVRHRCHSPSVASRPPSSRNEAISTSAMCGMTIAPRRLMQFRLFCAAVLAAGVSLTTADALACSRLSVPSLAIGTEDATTRAFPEEGTLAPAGTRVWVVDAEIYSAFDASVDQRTAASPQVRDASVQDLPASGCSLEVNGEAGTFRMSTLFIHGEARSRLRVLEPEVELREGDRVKVACDTGARTSFSVGARVDAPVESPSPGPVEVEAGSQGAGCACGGASQATFKIRPAGFTLVADLRTSLTRDGALNIEGLRDREDLNAFSSESTMSIVNPSDGPHTMQVVNFDFLGRASEPAEVSFSMPEAASCQTGTAHGTFLFAVAQGAMALLRRMRLQRRARA